MSALKTVVAFAVVAGVLVTAAKAQRVYEIEADSTVTPLIEQGVRMGAADFNPKVGLVVPELKGFAIDSVQITHSRIGAFLESMFGGGNRSYDVYVRYRESGDQKCLTLELRQEAATGSWKVTHPGAVERCAPVW